MMRLHYTYRKMETSQRHFHEESELVLRRQKSMLETLQFDNKLTQDKIDLFYPEVFMMNWTIFHFLNINFLFFHYVIEFEL